MIGLLKHTHIDDFYSEIAEVTIKQRDNVHGEASDSEQNCPHVQEKRKEKEDIANKLIGYLSQSLISH